MGEFEGTPRVYRDRPQVSVVSDRERLSHRRGQELARVATEGFYFAAFFSSLAYLAQIYAETKQALPHKEPPVVAGSPTAGSDTPKVTNVSPKKAPEIPKVEPIQKNISPELIAESEKILTALKSVGGTLRNQSPAFQKSPRAETLCVFVDTWYEKQKPNLTILWSYLDDSKSLWGQDMHSAMKTGFEIAQQVSKKEKAPKTPADFEEKLKHMLAEPAKTQTSCGPLFSTAILGLKALARVPFVGKDYIGDGQKMAEQMLIGTVEVIRKDIAVSIKENDSDRLTRAIAMAGLLGSVVDAAKTR